MLEAEGFRIVAGVPLVIEGRAIGTFVLRQATRRRNLRRTK